MAKTLHMETEDARRIQAEMQKTYDEMFRELNELNKQANSLTSTYWKGSASQIFEDLYSGWSKNMLTVLNQLNDHCKTLKDEIEQWVVTDSSL